MKWLVYFLIIFPDIYFFLRDTCYFFLLFSEHVFFNMRWSCISDTYSLRLSCVCYVSERKRDYLLYARAVWTPLYSRPNLWIYTYAIDTNTNLCVFARKYLRLCWGFLCWLFHSSILLLSRSPSPFSLFLCAYRYSHAAEPHAMQPSSSLEHCLFVPSLYNPLNESLPGTYIVHEVTLSLSFSLSPTPAPLAPSPFVLPPRHVLPPATPLWLDSRACPSFPAVYLSSSIVPQSWLVELVLPLRVGVNCAPPRFRSLRVFVSKRGYRESSITRYTKRNIAERCRERERERERVKERPGQR